MCSLIHLITTNGWWIPETYLNLPSDWSSSRSLLEMQATEEVFEIPSISDLFNEAVKTNSWLWFINTYSSKNYLYISHIYCEKMYSILTWIGSNKDNIFVRISSCCLLWMLIEWKELRIKTTILVFVCTFY